MFSPQGSALALLMLGVVTDDHDLALTLDDLAFFAHFLNRRSDFHDVPSFSVGYVSNSADYAYFERQVMRPLVRS